MTNLGITSVDQLRDVESRNYVHTALDGGKTLEEILPGVSAMARDNARTPMQWNSTPQAGFTDGVPWMEVNGNHTWINVAAQEGDPQSIVNWYRGLIDLRHNSMAVSDGTFEEVVTQDPLLVAFVRRHAMETVTVVLNLQSETSSSGMNVDEFGDLILTNYSTERTSAMFEPWEARVYVQREDLSCGRN